jgi:hypothetical protein
MKYNQSLLVLIFSCTLLSGASYAVIKTRSSALKKAEQSKTNAVEKKLNQSIQNKQDNKKVEPKVLRSHQKKESTQKNQLNQNDILEADKKHQETKKIAE